MPKAKYVIFKLLKYLTLLLGSFAIIIPIIVVFFASFKTSEEYGRSGALALPESFLNLANYQKAFVDGNMLLGFLNTFIILFVAITGAIIIGTMVAFVLSRFTFRTRNLILGAFLLATLIPGITTQVATFQIINRLGVYNTRLATILLYLGTDIIAVYIFMQFINSIPVSLDESAMLDGASYLTIYSRIILPLLKPAITTILIIKGVGIYNNFYLPFLYMPRKDLQVVSTALFKFKGPYGSQWGVICAGIIIAIIPTLILFLALQKYVYNGFTQGSVD
ncbi:MAG: carbohydrate ABC transporter permease [Halanaerobiales bacterium]|nr:carbohydrate ABC transporter permease [Halanaerobiales bacterium]